MTLDVDTRDMAVRIAMSLEHAVTAMHALDSGSEPVCVEGDTYADSDTVSAYLYARAYSIECRSGWDSNPDKWMPTEYRILLAGGGPAVRIFGTLDSDGQPDTARLEGQDWGTPWTAIPIDTKLSDGILTFARHVAYFYMEPKGV